MAVHIPAHTDVLSPVKISHYGIRTANMTRLKKWHLTVLGAAVVFESDKVCLMTFDDEHHRVAPIHSDAAFDPEARESGIDHVAVSYASLSDLVYTYERLKSVDITPHASINHGPTASLYYSDPDGNQLELLTDNFESVEDLKAWFKTGAHERHAGGKSFDPDEMVRRFHAGETRPEVLE